LPIVEPQIESTTSTDVIEPMTTDARGQLNPEEIAEIAAPIPLHRYAIGRNSAPIAMPVTSSSISTDLTVDGLALPARRQMINAQWTGRNRIPASNKVIG
jgi:hypothetical protein